MTHWIESLRKLAVFKSTVISHILGHFIVFDIQPMNIYKTEPIFMPKSRLSATLENHLPRIVFNIFNLWTYAEQKM